MIAWRTAVLFAAACSAPAVPAGPSAPSPADAAHLEAPRALPPPPPPTSTCRVVPEWRPGASYAQSASVVHLRVASATPGPTTDQQRCVALELEVVTAYRGAAKPGERVRVVVAQSMITHYTSRPAGAWWIVEQSLAPGSEYVALCPAGALADVLAGSCNVMDHAPYQADLALVHAAETARVTGLPLIAKLRAACAAANVLATGYVWEQTAAQARTELATFDALLGVVLEPACSTTTRAVLFDAVYGAGLERDALPHVRRLVRAMFQLLALPQAAGLHDNLIGTWLPNALGLDGGLPQRTAAEIFAGDPAGRTAATRTLAAYRGSADAGKLRAWLR